MQDTTRKPTELSSASVAHEGANTRADRQRPTQVFGYKLDPVTLTPIKRTLASRQNGKDSGADPIGNGQFRMYPSGDIVDFEERNRRLLQ